MGAYYNEIKRAMTLLATHPKAMFVGQSVRYAGTGMYDSLTHIPDEKKYEFPVAENLQMGVCTGLAIGGYLPIAIYPRWNFLLCAADQIVNHLDALPGMSNREIVPKVIIRVAIGSIHPIDPQNQHKGDFTNAFISMCHTINVVRLNEADQIYPAYKDALNSQFSTILVENSDFCKTK